MKVALPILFRQTNHNSKQLNFKNSNDSFSGVLDGGELVDVEVVGLRILRESGAGDHEGHRHRVEPDQLFLHLKLLGLSRHRSAGTSHGALGACATSGAKSCVC